jgi:hypothetical protein
MKKIATAIATSLFATSAAAADIYNGFGASNPDLSMGYATATNAVTGVQPSVGNSFDRYHGWADNNPDLFKSRGVSRSNHESPDRYGNFDDGNPDLQ